MNGKKKYQRRQFERNQEKYMASKFFGNVAVKDQIMFRCNTPTGSDVVVRPDYTLHLTPYSDMYLSVLFGATDRKGEFFYQIVTTTLNSVNSPLFVPFCSQGLCELAGAGLLLPLLLFLSSSVMKSYTGACDQ